MGSANFVGMKASGLKSPIFLFYLLVFYVLLQFSWWIYLIFTLYEEIYSEPGAIRQKVFMLVGEGSVFMLILVAGVIFIRRAFRREMEVSLQQQNFVLSVTHELKTPIASLKLLLQTLQSRKLEGAQQDELYVQSLTEIERLDGMVANILVTRSIEENNYRMNNSEVHLNQIVSDVIRQLKIGLLRNHVIEENLDPVVLSCDADAIRTITVNLIENAGKYSPAGSVISVSLKDSGPDVLLCVADHGKGIPDQNKLRVFEKFYREEDEMTRKTKGTGLGLFIVRYLMTLQGGSIRLTDNLPSGLNVELKFKK